MLVDLHTLAIVLGLINILQFVALFVQYTINTQKNGLGYFTLGSLFLSLGFTFNYLRDNPYWGLVSIIANNGFFLLALLSFYIGISLFFNQKRLFWPLYVFCIIILSIIIYFTLIDGNLNIRRIIISSAIAFIMLLCSFNLIKSKTKDLIISTLFLSTVFSLTALFFIFRVFFTLFSGLDETLFSASTSQVSMYFVILIASNLWTYSFIIMVNQKLNAQNREDKKSLELIFNTSPDAVLLTRLSDGLIIKINEGFTLLSGFGREEVIGKTVTDLNIWKSPEDRDKLINLLKINDSCNNLEIYLRRKDGEFRYGIISAKIIMLQGESHFISVTRDITSKREIELKLQDLMHQLEVEKKYAEKNAMTDGLTGLANRRSLDELLNIEFYRLKRSAEQLSLIMIDIDYFKKFNDKYGHLKGDDCLRLVASTIKTVVERAPDFAARYGGEEFLVVLPNTNTTGALLIAERIRSSVEALKIEHEDSSVNQYVTISLGVATVNPSMLANPEQAIEFADKALYNAKSKGRNCVDSFFSVKDTSLGEIEKDKNFVKLVWHSNYESKNEVIDSEHKELFESSNALLSAMVESKNKNEIAIHLEKLLTEIKKHFKDEEEILRISKYPFVLDHINLHIKLAEKAQSVHVKFLQDHLEIGDVFNFLAYDVVAQHMYLEDKKFFPYLNIPS